MRRLRPLGAQVGAGGVLPTQTPAFYDGHADAGPQGSFIYNQYGNTDSLSVIRTSYNVDIKYIIVLLRLIRPVSLRAARRTVTVYGRIKPGGLRVCSHRLRYG